MTYETHQFLTSLQERTELILQKAVGEWQMLTGESLSAKPSPEKWSAIQCLEHLNFYGDHYLPAIEKAIQTGRRKGSRPAAKFSLGWLGAYFTQLMLPQQDGRLKSTMKSPKNARPSSSPEPVATLAEFIDQQERILQLLEAAKSVNIKSLRVPISLSPLIRLSLCDTFGFVVAHNERHVIQAERAIAN